MRKLLATGASISALAALCSLSAANAEPTGGVIKAGTGVVHPEIGQTTTIDQTSSRLIIDWASFDVASNERVEFNQPTSDAIALNRILSGAPSTIAGQIIANGRVFLINADGVIFTSSANVDVNSLLATTMDIDNADFMADNFVFDQLGTAGAMISNAGSISAADAGMIAFVAPNVSNSGLLQANMGTVALASGEAFTLDFFGDDLIAFAAVNTDGAKTGSIDVSGTIEAQDGVIILTATAARDFINTVINVESDLVASSASMVGGKIILSGGENSEINIDADLNATGRDGGMIDVEGNIVTVAASANLLANADQGMGDGGTIRVNSFERTEFAGLASAQPGSSSGTGGDIFIGSDGVLVFSGLAQVGTPPRDGTITLSAGGVTSGGGGNTGGGNTGGGSTGGGGGGSVGGGGTPIVILPPSASDKVADVLSEIEASTPIQNFTPEVTNPGGAASARVFFGETVAFDFNQSANRSETASDRLFCLHGLSDAACGDDSDENE